MTEALHGAIVADALRVPWIAVKLFDHIIEFKWRDWCRSLGLNYSPLLLTRLLSDSRPNWSADELANHLMRARDAIDRTEPSLSSDSAIERATSRLQEQLEKLRADLTVRQIPNGDGIGCARAQQRTGL